MAKSNDDTQPAGKTRAQVLKDLEAAGLLRHLDQPARKPLATAPRKSIVIPFRKPDPAPPPALPEAKRRMAVLAYVVVAALIALVYFGLVTLP